MSLWDGYVLVVVLVFLITFPVSITSAAAHKRLDISEMVLGIFVASLIVSVLWPVTVIASLSHAAYRAGRAA